jgi:hypothetical protein
VAKAKRRYRHQPPLKGGRDPVLSCLLPEIRNALVELADTHNVRPSWVVAKILADAFGIKDQPDYSLSRKYRKVG